jgi:hypothetical protein
MEKFNKKKPMNINNVTIKFLDIIVVVVLVFMLISFNKLFEEKALIEFVTSKIKIENNDIHNSVVQTRNYLLDKYIQEPKSPEQLALWMNTRGLLRQSAADTLGGKVTRCGENSRLMVNVLRELGIKSKRLYLYGDPGTAHVLFEYYNQHDNKWYMVNSFNDQVEFKFLNSILDSNKIGTEDLFERYDVEDVVYYEATSLNYPLKKLFGPDVGVPYWLSYLMDAKHLLEVILLSGVMLFVVFIRSLLIRRDRNV